MSARFLPYFFCLYAAAAPVLAAAPYPRSASAPKAAEPAAADRPALKARPGPWGNIEWTVIYLEAPDRLLDSVQKPDANPHWCFPEADEASLRALFTRAGLSAEVQGRLFDPQRVLVQDRMLTLFPQIPDLKALTPEMREVIYPELAKYPINEFHRNPVFITGGLDEWLRETQLRPELQEVIRKMTYHAGRALAFSDLHTLLAHANSDAEVQHIFKTVTRTRALIGELKVAPGANVKALADYWTAGRGDSDVLPFLQAVAERSGGASIDLTHLMPSLMRRRLYTFPTLDLMVRGRLPDCHWTSLNFFNATPQDYYLDMRLAANRLLENYITVSAPYQFGDMLCLTNAAGEALHSCVYIADDVVLTKNGENSLKPWILMPLEEVREIYSREAPGGVQGFRLKSAAKT